MSLTERLAFDKALFRKVFLALVIILVAILSFGIGRLSVVGKSEPIRIEFDTSLAGGVQSASVVKAVSGGEVVASKNGSKYHYLHCSGAKSIKEENKLTFSTPKEAEASGYTLAANCKAR